MSSEYSDNDDFLPSDSGSDEETQRRKIREKLKNLDTTKLLSLTDQVKQELEAASSTAKRKHTNTDFKRANKNRPREISSKQKPKDIVVKKKQEPRPRDPRFDSMCGEFNKEEFKSNFKFVNDLRKGEVKQLKKMLEETKDVKEKKRLQFALHRLENQIREGEREEKEQQERYQERFKIKEQVKQGIKPHFKTKSENKLEKLTKKFEELREKNQLEKHIKRKSKKIAVKERRKLERHELI